MGSNGDALIRLEGIKKVFYTDEVETHALEEVHLEIGRGDPRHGTRRTVVAQVFLDRRIG